MDTPKNYKWSWTVDQRAILESGLMIDIIDFSILRMFMDFATCDACTKMTEKGVQFYKFRWQLVKDQFPTLKLNTRQSVKKRMKKLIDAKIIAPHPGNQKSRSAWFRFAENKEKLFNKKGKASTSNESYLNTSNQSLHTSNESYHTLATKVTLTSNESLHDNTTNNKDNNNTTLSIGQIKDLQRERESLKAELKELREKQPKPKRKRFSPPSIEQITEHFTQKGSDQAEAENFFNFYESNGWKVGKNKMVNWKAAGANWVKRNGKTHKPKTKNLVQRYVDYLNSHIENKILRKEHKKYEILYLIAGKDETVRQIDTFKSKLDITNPTYTDCFVFDITYGTLAKRAGTKPDRRMGEFKQFYNSLSDYNKNKGILRKLFKTYLIKKFG